MVSTALQIHNIYIVCITSNSAMDSPLAMDVSAIEEKISHYGKRTDSIVKGMLQHSRSASGQLELTEVNTLCEEYARLAYHGFKAREPDFNARMETDFDPAAGELEMVPADLGKVLLNLFNNAFYAVMEKTRSSPDGYEPRVRVKTNRLEATDGNQPWIEITITDNGKGIPEKIRDKIVQPFFTTKPTGQGTGLGLSLSYDIITKGYGGRIGFTSQVEGEAGKSEEETVFSIKLPANP